MLVMMLVAAALLVVIVVVLMLVMMLVATAMLIVMMSLLLESLYLRLKCRGSLYCVKQLCARELIPICGYYNRVCVMLLYKFNALVYLLLGYKLRMAEDDTSSVFYLVIEEFTKVLHVHFALLGVNNGGKSAKCSALCICTLNCLYNVGELSYSGGLDKYSVGGKLRYYLAESLSKITDKRAANTARIHFVYLHSGISKESAVNAYLAKFVFNKDDLLALIRLCEKLLYKSCFTRSEKSGKNIYLCHT